MVGIYKITSPSGKIYIGQSVDILYRWRCHKSEVHRSKLQSSFVKHGFENHTFEVLEECNRNLLNERERYWQDFYDVLGPNGLNLILTKTEEEVLIFSKETRERMSNSQKVYNSTLTKEQRLEKNRKNSESKKGQVKTKEHQDKITAGIRKRVLSEEARLNILKGSARGVVNTVTGETFITIKAAAESIGMKTYNLENRLRDFVPNNTNFKYQDSVQSK